MAEDKERKIVYYKGRPYYINKEDVLLSEIVDVSNISITKLVESKHLLSPEEFEKVKDSRRSEHQMWIPSFGRSKR